MSGSFAPSTAGIQAALPAQSQQNPLQQLSTLAGIQNTQVLNKLYQQDLLNKQQELTNAQTTNQGALFDQANAAVDRQAGAIMGILAKKDLTGQIGYDAIQQQQAGELANHPNNPLAQTAYETIMKQVPPPTQADGTPTPDATYREFAYQVGQRTLNARERIAALQRPLSYQNTPAGPVPVMGPSPAEQVINPGAQQTFNMGNGPQTGMIPQGISPAEGADIVNVTNPNGTIQPYTKQEIADQNLIARGYRITGPGTMAAPPATAPAAPTNGAMQPGVPAPGTGPTSLVTDPTNLPASKVLGGPRPSQGMIDTATASRNRDVSDMQAVASRDWADMTNSLNSVRNMSASVTSGPGSQYGNEGRALITNLLPNVAAALKIDPSQVQNQEEMWKMLSRISTSAGFNSDAQMFARMASNPNGEHMIPGALQRAAGYVLAINNQERIKTLEAHAIATHNPLSTDTQNAAVRNQIDLQTDPNAFRAPYMTDPEYAAYKQSLGPQGSPAWEKAQRTMDLINRYNIPAAGLTPTTSTTQSSP